MHFLTEFLTGTQFYLFILGVFTILFWVIPTKRQWIPFTVTVLLFAYFAHMLVPDRSDDLQLYFWFIDRIRAGGEETFAWVVKNDNFGWNTYFVCKYYYRAISLLPYDRDDHFLSSITVLITYGTAMRTIHRASKRFEVDKFHTYLGTMFFLATYWFYDSASGIRSSIAIGIVVACAYQQFVEKKHYTLCFVGYFLAAFFHPGGVIALALVVITWLTFNLEGRFFNIILLFSVALGTALINYLSSITEIGFIEALEERTEKYSQRAGDDSSTTFYVMVITVLVVTAVVIYVTHYLKEDERFPEYSKFYKYTANTLSFMFGILMISVVVSRFARWVIPQLGAVTFMVGMQIQKKLIETKGISKTMYFAPTMERLKFRLRPVVIGVWVIFTVVYIWYAVNGTSLIWAHFEHEWAEAGEPYIWDHWYGD